MRHIIRTLIPAHAFLALIVTTSLAAKVSDSLVIPAQQAGVRTVGGWVEGGWNLWSDGRVGQRMKISRTGLYTVVIRAWASPAGGTWPKMALLVNGLEVKFVSVDRNRPADYRFALDLEEGSHDTMWPLDSSTGASAMRTWTRALGWPSNSGGQGNAAHHS
jgi:Ca-dependent carbohydrate-binding module xylan-binding